MKIRAETEGNYTVVHNTILQDSTISYKAKGLFIDMLSLPDDWIFTVQGLTKRSTDGKTSIVNAIKELVEAGYIARKQNRTQGKFAANEYVIMEVPECTLPSAEKPTAGKPSTVTPLAEKPTTVNRTLQNTIIQNINYNKRLINKIPPISPKSDLPLTEKPPTAKGGIDKLLDTVEDEVLREALSEFVKMRRQIKKPLTPRALELNIKKLYRMSGDNAERTHIVEQSVMNSWQSFYPLKAGESSSRSYGANGDVFALIGKERGLI